MDATTVAMCDLEDRIASDYETGFSEQALRQLMKEAFLLEMERKRQMGEAMLSGKVAPLQADFVNDEQQRLLEIEDMRLVVKFGEKKRYSDQECQAIYQELIAAGLDEEARRNPDAIEAVFRELNAVDEAAAARRYQRLSRKRSVNHADGMIAAASLCGEVAAASRWLTAAHVRNANPRGSSIARPAR